MATDAATWLGIDKDLVLTFFFEFSRFEYALKRAGFVPQSTPEGKPPDAKPDWDRFAKEIKDAWTSIKGDGFKEACAFFIAKPPQKQVVIDHTLDWKDTTRNNGESDAAFVLRCVRTVRNNLFHGGKFPMRPLPSPERDTQLLQSGLAVLRGALTLNERVRSYFEEKS